MFLETQEALRKLADMPKKAQAAFELRLPTVEVFAVLNPEFLATPGAPLTEDERKDAEAVFGKSLNLDVVRVAGVKLKLEHVMVWGNTVRFPTGTYDRAILIHELMHVWQYQHGGALYISRSLMAYACDKEATRYELVEGKSLFDYNVEQQAQIVQDYFAGRRWDRRYQRLIDELRARRPLLLPTGAVIENAAGPQPTLPRPHGRPLDGDLWVPQIEIRF